MFTRRPLNRMTMIGLVSLCVANLSRWYLTHHSTLSENSTDGLIGFFTGVAIAAMLIGTWRSRWQPPSTAGCD